MTKYISLLRGINVGGNKIIKMDDLRTLFSSLKFSEVQTYIQSGNVVFTTPEKDMNLLVKKIETALLKKMGSEVSVLLRTSEQMQTIVAQNPLAKKKIAADEKGYVVFLPFDFSLKVKTPLFSLHKDVEVFLLKDATAYCISRAYKGKYGFPNAFCEKIFGVVATTRNWETVKNVAMM